MIALFLKFVIYNCFGIIFFTRSPADKIMESIGDSDNSIAVINFELSEKSNLNFSVNANFSPNREFDNDVTTEMRNASGGLDSTLVTDSGVFTDQNNVALNLDYTTSFDNGGDLSLKAHYTRFDQDREQTVFSQYFNPQGQRLDALEFETDASQVVDIYTAQADYSTTIGESAFESGLKYSAIESESGIEYMNERRLESLYDELGDVFLYDENIYAAYLSISHDWTKWSGKLGLRGNIPIEQGRA